MRSSAGSGVCGERHGIAIGRPGPVTLQLVWPSRLRLSGAWLGWARPGSLGEGTDHQRARTFSGEWHGIGSIVQARSRGGRLTVPIEAEQAWPGRDGSVREMVISGLGRFLGSGAGLGSVGRGPVRL